MDINGAKALKERLGSKVADEAPPASADVSEGAPPVYHWLGVKHETSEAPAVDAEDDPAPTESLFRKLGLSFR